MVVLRYLVAVLSCAGVGAVERAVLIHVSSEGGPAKGRKLRLALWAGGPVVTPPALCSGAMCQESCQAGLPSLPS